MGRTVTEEERKAAAAKYIREWRSKNKDKVREYNRRYWEKRAVLKTGGRQ